MGKDLVWNIEQSSTLTAVAILMVPFTVAEMEGQSTSPVRRNVPSISNDSQPDMKLESLPCLQL